MPTVRKTPKPSPEEAAATRRVTFWTAVLPALLGLLGGGVAGLATAYVQLQTKSEEFDISRAEKFTILLDALVDEKKAGLALLNLWQLYPTEQYRRVIVGTAITIEQPEILEYIGYADAGRDAYSLSDALYTHAQSTNAEVAGEARALLERVDPDRAAPLIVEELERLVRTHEGRIPGNAHQSLVQRLRLLTKSSDATVRLVRQKSAEEEVGLFFDYVLYLAEQESRFLPRLMEGYAAGDDLVFLNDYTYRATFHDRDQAEVVAGVSSSILDWLEAEDSDDFITAGAVLSLKNNGLNADIENRVEPGFTEKLLEVVASPSYQDSLREASLNLLYTYAFPDAVRAFVTTQVAGDPAARGAGLSELFPSQRRIEASLDKYSGFALPDCQGAAYRDCIELRPEIWRAWLDQSG